MVLTKSKKMRAVVVTGASSGIGRAIALHLARQKDFTVLATVRKFEDAKAIDELRQTNLHAIADVDLAERPKQVRAVRKILLSLRSEGVDGLYAIINNAGDGEIAPLELLDMDVLQKELRTRVLGPGTLVQMLLPEIRKGHGRLIWITTPGPIPLVTKVRSTCRSLRYTGWRAPFGLSSLLGIYRVL